MRVGNASLEVAQVRVDKSLRTEDQSVLNIQVSEYRSNKAIGSRSRVLQEVYFTLNAREGKYVMTPKITTTKIFVSLLIVAVIGLTLWMQWETIREKLMPDYGTDPYTLDSSQCKKKP